MKTVTTKKIASPEEIVQIGDQVEVAVLKVDTDERKIGLSLIAADDGSGPKIVRKPGAKKEEPKAETPEAPPAGA